MITLVAMATYV